MSDGGYDQKPVAGMSKSKGSGAPKPKGPIKARIMKVVDNTRERIVTIASGSEQGIQLHAKARMLGDGLFDRDLQIDDVEGITCRAATLETVDSLQQEKPRWVEIDP